MMARVSPAVCVALALAAIPGMAGAQDEGGEGAKPVAVDVVLSNFAFTPKVLHLRRGQAYRLHFVNRGSGGHNFRSPGFFQAVRVAAEDEKTVAGGKVELGKGESADVRLVALTPGAYKVRCSHTLHAAMGMTGSAVIE